MKKKEIREMSEEDLKNKIDELKKELMKLHTQVARGTTIKSPGQIRQAKKTIAQIKTVLKIKEEQKKG